MSVCRKNIKRNENKVDFVPSSLIRWCWEQWATWWSIRRGWRQPRARVYIWNYLCPLACISQEVWLGWRSQYKPFDSCQFHHPGAQLHLALGMWWWSRQQKCWQRRKGKQWRRQCRKWTFLSEKVEMVHDLYQLLPSNVAESCKKLQMPT